MKRKLISIFTLFSVALGHIVGCGEDPGRYREETLNFTYPVSAKVEKKTVKKEEELDLVEQESSNFLTGRYGAYIPWAPVPLFDYYLQPLPIQVPVNPFYSLIDFVHPFYAPFFLSGPDDDDWSGTSDFAWRADRGGPIDFYGNDWGPRVPFGP